MIKNWRILSVLIAIGYFPLAVTAQQKTSGKVVSQKDQNPLAGISISIKSTTKGTSTNTLGEFTIETQPGDILVFSGIGFKTHEEKVDNSNNLLIQLEDVSTALSEVVVTALGVKRETKRLGYAVQEVKGSEMDKARETNFVSGLAGKVAGVQVMTSPSGVGGSARVTIRGDKSLDINKNQPLFIVDGVPITNDLTGSTGRSYQEIDYGNGSAMINPDDIETITVLKGANATALYGSRAANGAIVITTKSGKNSQGIGVSVNTGFTLEKPLILPKLQKVYGQGNNGLFSFYDGKAGGVNDGVDESWGPKMDGSMIAQLNSPTSNGYRGGDISLVDDGLLGSAADMAARGTITPIPFIPGNDLHKFYETGITNNTNIALTAGNEKGDFRLSYTLLDQKGIIPNTDIKRNTFAFNSGYHFTPKFSVRATANYINTHSNNRPNLSYGTENVVYLLNVWMPQSVDLNSLKNYWISGMEDRQQFNFNYNYHDNPYFNLYENTNGQDADRIFGNITLRYEIADWINIQLRGGTDLNSELRKRKRAFSTMRFRYGSYREERVRNSETNMDFLVSVNKNITDKFSFGLNVGGNKQISRMNNYEVTAPELLIPGIYSLNNNKVALVHSVYDGNKIINSIYGALQLAYDNFLFLDVTARNDWSSSLTLPTKVDTLGKTVNSYFYPSASLSTVLSDIFELPSWISFAKLRTSIAQVGNDTDPYRFSFTYGVSDPWAGMPAYYLPSNLLNYNLKPEISTSYEAGLDWRFFNNRLGVDFSYYDINTRNQILPSVPVSVTSGASSRVVNAGKIRNYGYELMLTGRPIENQNFKWDVTINWSSNKSKVLEFDGNVTTYNMANRHGIYINATVGQKMGDMYSIGFRKVDDPNSPYYGQQIFNNEGRFLGTNELVKVGNYNPKWLAGIINSFSYKNFNLSFLVDARYGGQIFSETWVVGLEAGQLIETLEGREDGYDLSKAGNGIIGKGVIQNSDGSYRINDIKLTAREYHQSRTGNRDIEQGGIFNADYIKFRELRFGYSFAPRFLSRIKAKTLNLSIVGRNLAVWSKVPHIDPETAALSGGTIIPGVESVGMPTARSFGLNLGFNF